MNKAEKWLRFGKPHRRIKTRTSRHNPAHISKWLRLGSRQSGQHLPQIVVGFVSEQGNWLRFGSSICASGDCVNDSEIEKWLRLGSPNCRIGTRSSRHNPAPISKWLRLGSRQTGRHLPQIASGFVAHVPELVVVPGSTPKHSFPRSSVGMPPWTLPRPYFAEGRRRGASGTAFPRRTMGTRISLRIHQSGDMSRLRFG